MTNQKSNGCLVWRLNCRTKKVLVETARGGLGEFGVSIDGQKIIDTNHLWYPRVNEVVAEARKLFAKQTS